VLANMSARVGSIGDNRLGGWYAYRTSKAAQNMLTRTMALEFKRNRSGTICVALHPGTTDTGLSKPFQENVPEKQLFTVAYTVRRLLQVIDGLHPRDTGQFFAFDGELIEW
jgi:NAD(P)-dependent dehydrogenase (short-subunit alcohol dehydrogenase family)